MVAISNKLADTSPISEQVLKAEATKAFESSKDDIQKGIEAYLSQLTARAEAQNYKFVVTVSSMDENTQGPLKTYTGAYWNAEQDGIWAVHLDQLNLLVTVIWTRI